MAFLQLSIPCLSYFQFQTFSQNFGVPEPRIKEVYKDEMAIENVVEYRFRWDELKFIDSVLISNRSLRALDFLMMENVWIEIDCPHVYIRQNDVKIDLSGVWFIIAKCASIKVKITSGFKSDALARSFLRVFKEVKYLHIESDVDVSNFQLSPEQKANIKQLFCSPTVLLDPGFQGLDLDRYYPIPNFYNFRDEVDAKKVEKKCWTAILGLKTKKLVLNTIGFNLGKGRNGFVEELEINEDMFYFQKYLYMEILTKFSKVEKLIINVNKSQATCFLFSNVVKVVEDVFARAQDAELNRILKKHKIEVIYNIERVFEVFHLETHNTAEKQLMDFKAANESMVSTDIYKDKDGIIYHVDITQNDTNLKFNFDFTIYHNFSHPYYTKTDEVADCYDEDAREKVWDHKCSTEEERVKEKLLTPGLGIGMK